MKLVRTDEPGLRPKPKDTHPHQGPFVTWSKADILRAGLEMEIDYSQTWSCYEGKELACGRCPTCAERLSAFSELGIPDPLPYTAQPKS